jgi:hypothetical protein
VFERLDAPQNRSANDAVALFCEVPRHTTLEGVVLGAVTVLFLLTIVWWAAEPLIYRVLPELGATKEGPQGFPIVVHIGQDNLEFTNRSSEHWDCKVEVGVSWRYVGKIEVAPQETHQVVYTQFQSESDPIDADLLRSGAREMIEVDCVEPSGITHWWRF